MGIFYEIAFSIAFLKPQKILILPGIQMIILPTHTPQKN